MAFAHAVRWLTKSAGASLSDDCIEVIGSGENVGIGVQLASNLDIGGSGPRSGEGGGFWFDQM